MDAHEKPGFAHALARLSIITRDGLSSDQLQAYWELMAPRMTLEEWEACCLAVLEQETYHRVPMPAVFLRALERVRDQARRAVERQHSAGMPDAHDAMLAAEQARRADPVYAAETEAAMHEAFDALSRLLGENWRSVVDAQAASAQDARRRALEGRLRDPAYPHLPGGRVLCYPPLYESTPPL